MRRACQIAVVYCLALICLLALPASANTIWINNSSFSATTPSLLMFRSAPADFIDWCPQNTGSSAGSCGVRNDATGDILIQPGTGNFSGLSPNTSGLILDLADVFAATGPAPGAPYTFFAPGVPKSNIQHFQTISSHPEWNFIANLMEVPFPCLATEICIGPFKFTPINNPLAPSTALEMRFQGTVVDTIDLASASFETVVTTVYDKDSSSVIALMHTSGGVFSGEVNVTTTITATAVPEPGTFVLFTSGLLLAGTGSSMLAAVRRRREANRTTG